jgi:hypothetical protein
LALWNLFTAKLCFNKKSPFSTKSQNGQKKPERVQKLTLIAAKMLVSLPFQLFDHFTLCLAGLEG